MRKFMFGMLMFGAGAAAGALAGVLNAPHKGTITRAKLRAKMAEKKERSQEKMYGMKSKMKELGSGRQEAHAESY